MAHGTPRINACFKCGRYIFVARFSPDPPCPVCSKITEQTTKERLRKKFNLSLFAPLVLGFNYWGKIKKP